MNDLQLKVFSFIRDTKKEYEELNPDQQVSDISIDIEKAYNGSKVVTNLSDVYLKVTSSNRY